ncbi:MAG: nickel-dependent lactate racemase, partial [Clostridia bacterium]|nr:nickel-dependent lactate racemase [Clostridia bacterium]
ASERLCNLARGKRSVLIITSDHTRPVPSRITMPLLLSEVRKHNPDIAVKILIATGFHRATTPGEMRERFGETICENEDIIVHDAFDASAIVGKGTLPSGGELKINKLVDWADLIVAEGFIEPHFFAGYSGGRKSILPGICSADTIMYNHNAKFIAHQNARTGVIENNPMHADMVYAAKQVGLAFILNVTLDENKKITAAFAGDSVTAHETGCESLKAHASVGAVHANLLITSNGGYPLDQNIYQAVKSMTAAESCVKPGGVIIVVASCINGHGGEGFYNWFTQSSSVGDVAQRIGAIDPSNTLPDQWEAQILARVLQKCKAVILVSSHVEPKLVTDMYMTHATSIEQALRIADELLGSREDIVVIPDGVGVIIEETK